ncbi:MAG: sialate O-acetylesterase [Planctomycetota bacterium]|nr:sialate O-acetylesterase [Planctomycetota bacterium]
MHRFFLIPISFFVLVHCFGTTSIAAQSETDDLSKNSPKVKVFILAGQSNMEGHGQLRSLDMLGNDPDHGHLLSLLKNKDGSWATRSDVTISWQAKRQKSGPLTVGWGYNDNEIGPELLFGAIVGEHFEEPVLLIKTAWGGKDVYCDFRSPGAGKPVGADAALLEHQSSDGHKREVGHFYRKMISEIQQCLEDIDKVVPGYQGQGYELAGMAWFQGWNDFCQWHVRIDDERIGEQLIENYPKNLAAMFRDVRTDLKAPDMPIAIGEMGVGGHEMTARARKNPDDGEATAMMNFRRAQQLVANDPALERVYFVPTVDFWDTRLQELRRISDDWWNEKQEKGIADTEENHLPTTELNEEFKSRGGHWYCHYNGSASNYSLVGYALAEMLLNEKPQQ